VFRIAASFPDEGLEARELTEAAMPNESDVQITRLPVDSKIESYRGI
jgi:hypothetical protein